MRITKHKVFLLWSYEKEEKWLNEMASSGWNLIRVGFCTYEFERGEPGEFVYRLQMLDDMPSSVDGIRYIQFLESTGAEHVGSLFRWVYFRKKASDGQFELFSDIDTRLRHMRGILLLAGLLGGLNLYNGLHQLCRYFFDNTEASLVLGILCTAVGLLGAYGFIRLLLIRRRMLRERALHE